MFGLFSNKPADDKPASAYTTVGKLAQYKARVDAFGPMQLFKEQTIKSKAHALYKVIEHILTSEPEDLTFGRPYNDSDTLGLLWDTGYEIILVYDHPLRNLDGVLLYDKPCILVRPNFNAFWGFNVNTMNDSNVIILQKLQEKYEGSIMYKWYDLRIYDNSCLTVPISAGVLHAGIGLKEQDYELKATYPLTDRLIIPFPN